MVSEPGLIEGPRFEPPLCNLFLICSFESPWRTLFGLFNSPCAGMVLHMKEGGVKGMIFVLNSNPISLSF